MLSLRTKLKINSFWLKILISKVIKSIRLVSDSNAKWMSKTISAINLKIFCSLFAKFNVRVNTLSDIRNSSFGSMERVFVLISRYNFRAINHNQLVDGINSIIVFTMLNKAFEELMVWLFGNTFDISYTHNIPIVRIAWKAFFSKLLLIFALISKSKVNIDSFPLLLTRIIFHLKSALNMYFVWNNPTFFEIKWFIFYIIFSHKILKNFII